MNITRISLAVLLIAVSATLSGCGLIFGGDQSVDTKSRDYSVLRLDKLQRSKWRTIESRSTPDSSDVAYENPSTGSIISLNSICRGNEKSSLKELSRALMMGLKKQSSIETREYSISGISALESTVDAETIDHKTVRIRTVVMRKDRCTYDVMYVSPRENFHRELNVFNDFLKGFHVE